MTDAAERRVDLSWNGHALKHENWVIAGSHEPSELTVAAVERSSGGTFGEEIRCYLDGVQLTPHSVALAGSAFRIPPPERPLAGRELVVRVVDSSNCERQALPRAISIIPRSRVTACKWMIRVTAVLLVLVSWRLWHLKVSDDWSQLAGAISTLLTGVAALFGASWWRSNLTDWLETRTSYPRHMGVVALLCVGSVLGAAYVIHGFVRVVHNATDHEIRVAWAADAPEETLRPGAVEVVWSALGGASFVDSFFLPKLIPRSDAVQPLYCGGDDEKSCRRFRRGQEDVGVMHALFSIAPVVSLGCTIREWRILPGMSSRVEPNGTDCLPKPTTSLVPIGGGALGLFEYREGESVSDQIAADEEGSAAGDSAASSTRQRARLRVTVRFGMQNASDVPLGSAPEKVRVTVDATDHGIFRQAELVTTLDQVGKADQPAPFPVPSLRHAYTTRLVLGPEAGTAFGTLDCHPRDQDVDVWIVPSVSGSILRAQIKEADGRIHSEWVAQPSKVGGGGSPVFGLCLPRVPSENLELELVVRELGRVLEPTSFSLPAELTPIRMRVFSERYDGASLEIGELACSLDEGASIAMLVRPGAGRRVALLRPGGPVAGRRGQAAVDAKSEFSSWTVAVDAPERIHMFQCLEAPNCNGTTIVATVSGSHLERWSFDLTSRTFTPPKALPACTLNARGELVRSCPEGKSAAAGESAADFWSKKIWLDMMQELKPQGCSLSSARVCQ